MEIELNGIRIFLAMYILYNLHYKDVPLISRLNVAAQAILKDVTYKYHKILFQSRSEI